jgi:terminal uridylyltransferase
MSAQQQNGGFDPHVWDQLSDAASQTSRSSRGGRRGRGQYRGSRGPGRPIDHVSQHHGPATPPFQAPPPPIDAFPPLGAQPSLAPLRQSSMPLPPQSQHRPTFRGNSHRTTSREFLGDAHSAQRNFSTGQQYDLPPSQPYGIPHDDFSRPSAPSGNAVRFVDSHKRGAPPVRNAESDRAMRLEVMTQSDYLNKVQAAVRQKYQLKVEEQIEKETFRRHLEAAFQTALRQRHPNVDVAQIRLRCYGSLNNGFGLAQCDMDLLLSLPEELDLINNVPDPLQSDIIGPVSSVVPQGSSNKDKESSAKDGQQEGRFEVARILEDTLLEMGIGARLLTKTRVPIMRICERPTMELLTSLRAAHEKEREALQNGDAIQEEALAIPPELSLSEVAKALEVLIPESEAAQIGLPDDQSSKMRQPALEFTGDCGIQCDVNFTNSVAIHNTRLLRTYCQYDSRVAEVGTFVKAWAKIRDINTPYWGTLSSYGYTLMVLHYLMNVVQPPVIPNLQVLAHTEDSWNHHQAPLYHDKYDIRFWDDDAKIREFRNAQPRNRESTGHLLRGFFWYYSAYEGFNWKNDVISIRTKGGIVRKTNKGWTEARWSDQAKNVRQRYLLAIEDPFEIDHNVGRVVGHNGIVAIRDEFRRAWSLISSIKDQAGFIDDALVEPAEPRGDLLHKDMEHRRERVRNMKKAAEDREKASLKNNLASSSAPTGDSAFEGGEETGMLHQESWSPEPLAKPRPSSHRPARNAQLTTTLNTDQDNLPQIKYGRLRKVKFESEDEDGERGKITDQDPDILKAELEKQPLEDPEPFCPAAEVPDSLGFDIDGKPSPWNMDSQDGRWLQWRDNKIREGTWRGTRQPSLNAHDEAYPYDPRRAPASMSTGAIEAVLKAPYPMPKEPPATSESVAADVKKRKWKKSRTQPTRAESLKQSFDKDIVALIDAGDAPKTVGDSGVHQPDLSVSDNTYNSHSDAVFSTTSKSQQPWELTDIVPPVMRLVSGTTMSSTTYMDQHYIKPRNGSDRWSNPSLRPIRSPGAT